MTQPVTYAAVAVNPLESSESGFARFRRLQRERFGSSPFNPSPEDLARDEAERREAEAERYRRRDPIRHGIAEAEEMAHASDQRARAALQPIVDCKRLSKAARALALEKAMAAFVEGWAAARCAALLQAELDKLEKVRP